MIETILGILKYLKYKVIFAIVPAGIFCWSDNHKKIVLIIILMLILDLILGVMVAVRYKRFSSCKMAKTSYKFSLYGLAMGTAYLVSLIDVYLNWVFYYMGAFIAMNEAFSNFEKLALLGFNTPTKILSKINLDFSRVYANNGEKAVALERILEKDHCMGTLRKIK